jgi:hypothetical protein
MADFSSNRCGVLSLIQQSFDFHGGQLIRVARQYQRGVRVFHPPQEPSDKREVGHGGFVDDDELGRGQGITVAEQAVQGLGRWDTF